MTTSEEKSRLPLLEVESGPDKGKHIRVPEGEITVGRSGDNDIQLADPILSRRQCQFSYKEGRLKVRDLDSSNGTLVNDVEVKEAELHDGDRILVGDTLLRVTNLRAPPPAPTPSVSIDIPSAPAPQGPAPASENPSVVVDLGFDKGAGAPDAQRPANWRPLIWGVGALAVLAIAISLILRTPDDAPAPVAKVPEAPSILPLEIAYEKIEATTSSVFRYSMSLDATGLLAVEIDDLSEDRHVRKESLVPSNRVAQLASQIDRGDFRHLQDRYEGVPREGMFASWDITVVLGRRAQRTVVSNRLEPSAFQEVREQLETFGKNELGIWAIQYSREKLLELANEAFTRALNAYEDRGIDYGNLAEAIKRYKEASFYLDTIDPKPDFFPDIVSGLARSEEELTRRYEEQRFLADRAINLQDWQAARRELTILRELIPDRDDPRNQEASRKLLDVENRLREKEK